MTKLNNFAWGLRVANFSALDLPIDTQLKFRFEDETTIINTLKRYTNLPYVFVVDKEQVDKIPGIVSSLKSGRSRCYPHAVFTVKGAEPEINSSDMEIISLDSHVPADAAGQIEKFASDRFRFDTNRLDIQNENRLPDTIDVVIVGAGVVGLYAANRLKESNISFCILEKRTYVGGIWSLYANTTSRVNTSEEAYRLLEKNSRANRDHSATREVLEDIVRLATEVSQSIFCNTEVIRIDKTDTGYRTSLINGGKTVVLESKGAILAINDRIGPPREIIWPNQSAFQGQVVTGISDRAVHVDWRDKQVAVVGMGAFAIENVRTALEGGARHVTVVCRRHGTVCPKIIDYLNFSTPYDENFMHDKKSNIRNMMHWKKLYELSGATEPECWMAKIKHPGHTISVSDIWFIAHHLKRVETVTGAVSELYDKGVVVNGSRQVEADLIVNCVGFERNSTAARTVSGYSEISNTNYLDKDLMYLADAYIDDNAFNSFFGSSVLEMAKFYLKIYIKFFDSPEYEKMLSLEGITKVPIDDRKWTDYIGGASVLVDHYPDLKEEAWNQVNLRTNNFMEQHDLKAYIAENKREWLELHTMLAGRPISEVECLPYVFEQLLPDK